MSLLLFLARAFVQTFGITQPTPQQERRAAWFIATLLLVVVVAVMLVFVAFTTAHRSL